jgi:hypothetical protein
MVKQLFIDGSVHPQTKVGFGAYLIYDSTAKEQTIQHKRFDNTSSTLQELQTFLWAFKDERLHEQKVQVYTDCQNLLSLLKRRKKLQNNGYMTSSGKRLKHWALYELFYEITDRFDCEIIKVQGHKKNRFKDEQDKIFSLVDKQARTLLRAYLNNI